MKKQFFVASILIVALLLTMGCAPAVDPAPTTYTVTFDSQGGSAVSALTNVSSGAKITAPTAPTKSSYTFAGWYKETSLTNAWSFSTDTVTANITLYAKWTAVATTTYTVSFTVNGGSPAPSDITGVTSGSKITAPTAPTKTGYTFDNWYKDSGFATVWDFTVDTVTANITLYAKWLAVPDTTPPANVTNALATAGDAQATLSWTEPSDTDFAGVEISGDNGVTTITVNKGTTSKAITGLTNGTTYTFTIRSVDTTGNKSIGALVSALPTATAPTTYIVNFSVDGGTTVASMPNVTSGSLVTKPTDPTKTGYTFGGWYKEVGLTTAWIFASDTVTGNTTLYAKWIINTYTVTFDLQAGAGTANPVTTNYNTTITLPTAPTKTGYTFGGWWTALNGGGVKFDATTAVTGDVIVYADWIAVSCTVTYDSQSATTASNPTSQVVTFPATTVVTLPTAPTKTGYTFIGWNTAINGGGSSFTGSTTVSANITVYAYWKSSDATLSALSLAEATISPTFASGTISYTASVANSVTAVTVTATKNDSTATVVIAGDTSLAVGTNNVTATVTAQDGTTNVYTIVVTRAATISGNIYYIESGVKNIYKKIPGGAESTYTTTVNTPTAITIDSSGNIYYIESGVKNIYKKIPGGAESTYTTTVNTPICILIN